MRKAFSASATALRICEDDPIKTLNKDLLRRRFGVRLHNRMWEEYRVIPTRRVGYEYDVCPAANQKQTMSSMSP